jgi:hypothetical protein
VTTANAGGTNGEVVFKGIPPLPFFHGKNEKSIEI